MLGIIDTLEKWVQPFKDFIMKNHGNPLLWTGLVLLGLIVFGFTYNALNKNK